MFQFDDVIMGGTPREETDGDNFKRFLSLVQLIALQWLMIKYFHSVKFHTAGVCSSGVRTLTLF